MTLMQASVAAEWLGYLVAVLLLGFCLDRLLLRAEARGWINYRRNGLSRPGAIYHALELQSIFDPGIRQVIEVRCEERKNQDESGDPLVWDTGRE
jgi:hypothetical protein